MTPTCTYENHNLGDQLVFLHLIRALAKEHDERIFWHFTNGCHLAQLNEVIEDLPNVALFSFESEQWKDWDKRAINVWKNASATDTRFDRTQHYRAGFWEKSRNRFDWSAFTLEHHAHVAKLMGCVSPFTIREHLLFDYPALNPNNSPGNSFFYDLLICNSEPCSGQFGPMKQHGSGYLDDFIKQLAKKNNVITTSPVYGIECTRDNKRSVTDIGRLSLKCRHHVMVATGPMWGCLNTTNHHNSAGRRRVVLLDNMEQLNMPGITQCTTLGHVCDIAKQEGWL